MREGGIVVRDGAKGERLLVKKEEVGMETVCMTDCWIEIKFEVLSGIERCIYFSFSSWVAKEEGIV